LGSRRLRADPAFVLHTLLVVTSSLLPYVCAAQAAPEEIVVTGSIVGVRKRELGTAVSVVEAPEMELRGYDGLADVLRTQPGIGVTNAGGPGKSTVLRIRGEEGYRTLLIIDGVKALDASAPQVGPSLDSLLVTSDMQRVEILRGPQGFIYGADAGGVVNVITGRGAGPLGGRLGVELGRFGTRKVEGSLSGGGDRGDYYVSVENLTTDGFNAQTADDVLRDRDGADNTTVHTKLGLNLRNDWRVQLVARNVDASTMYDGCFSPTTFATVNDCVATTDQTTYKVSAVHGGESLTHSFGYSNIDIDRADFAEGGNAFSSRGRLDRFEYTGSYRPGAGSTLVYGADLQREDARSDERLTRRQDGYYVEYQGELGKSLFLSLGTRYDVNPDFGAHLSSRASAAYVDDLGDGRWVKYRASYGTGFRAPSLFEVAYDRGPFAFPPAAGLRLNEETSEGHDLGIEYGRQGGMRFEATYFDQRLKDEIFFDLDAFSGYLQSQGNSSSKGLELAASVPFGERLELLGNLTYDRAKDTANAQRLRRPRVFGNVGLLYGDDALRFVVNYRFARDSIDAGRVALDDYGVVDFSLTRSLAHGVELFGRVENVADAVYQEVAGFNTAGRAVYGGVRIRL
jgi:vitamin B12 transporter